MNLNAYSDKMSMSNNNAGVNANQNNQSLAAEGVVERGRFVISILADIYTYMCGNVPDLRRARALFTLLERVYTVYSLSFLFRCFCIQQQIMIHCQYLLFTILNSICQ